MHSGKDPDFVVRNPSESQGGVLETYITVGMNISNIIFTNIFPRLVKTAGKNFVMGSALYLTMKTIRYMYLIGSLEKINPAKKIRNGQF